MTSSSKPVAIRLPESREEWLKQRNSGIGGSDAGAIMGVNQYRSAYTVWAEKTGFRKPTNTDSEAMRQGRDLEDYVAKRFTEKTGKKVQRSGFSYQSAEHPFMLANIDRRVVGENAGLECKTANIFAEDGYQKGGLPMSYYCQCLHYMAVMGYDRMYLAALVYGRNFFVFEIDRSDPGVAEDIDALIHAESEFWELVQSQIPPEIDGSQSTKQTLNAAFNPEAAEDADLSDLELDFKARDAVREQIRELQEQQTRIENRIRASMQSAECGRSPSYKATWKTEKRKTFDREAFEADHPGMIADYTTVSSSRVLRISKIKEKRTKNDNN